MMSRHESNPESLRVTCTKGCGACCHFPIIPATGGEAFVLLARLLAEGRTLEELHSQFMTYARRYLEHAQRNQSLPLTDDQQRKFLHEKLPCPLFVATADIGPMGGYCGVYAYRPLICDFFHSLESPELCLLKKPHASFSDVSERGHEAIDEVRAIERELFGRSVLGHLPLLMAALLTDSGMKSFLTRVEIDPNEENAQDIADFGLYVELISCLGYGWGDAEWASLAIAQAEMI
ncbi:hypothetical protein EBU99_01380 [bacterium]|nr:hypothetical protein [bacterium]